MKDAVIEINPDWKAALRAGAKGIRQAAQSGCVQQFTFSYASPELLFSEISHWLERERIHLLLIEDAKRGLADLEAGRTCEADAAIAQLQQRRAGATTDQPAKKRG
jgi:hypothetical protein